MPVAGFEEDGDDSCCTYFVALYGLFQFLLIAAIGGDNVKADEDQDDLVGLQLMCDRTIPFHPRINFPLPEANFFLAF